MIGSQDFYQIEDLAALTRKYVLYSKEYPAKESQMKQPSLYKIFFTFLKIGAFTFGGGYAMLPINREAVVTKEHWVTDDGFIDMIGITQSVPGALAVNSAIFLGYQIAGVPGALIATLGAVLPSFLIIL